MALMLRFSDNGGLKIPATTGNEYRYLCRVLDVENVTFIGEISPTYIWSEVFCQNVTMSYAQFRMFFSGGMNWSGQRHRFEELMLTDIEGADLFTGFAFPRQLAIRFSPEMRESLKGKTFDFDIEHRWRLNSLRLTVPNLEEVNFRPLGLLNEPQPNFTWRFGQIE